MLKSVKRQTSSEKNRALVEHLEPYLWASSDLSEIIGKCEPNAVNSFVIGPNGLDTTIQFLFEYHAHIAQPTWRTGLSNSVRCNESRKAEGFFQTVYSRVDEIRTRLTRVNSRYLIDPPGYRNTLMGYMAMGDTLPVSILIRLTLGMWLTIFSYTDC